MTFALHPGHTPRTTAAAWAAGTLESTGATTLGGLRVVTKPKPVFAGAGGAGAAFAGADAAATGAAATGAAAGGAAALLGGGLAPI